MSYLKKIKNKNTSFQPRNQYKKKKQKQKTCNRFRIFFLKHDATPETNFNTDLIDPFMSCYLSNVILYSLMSLKWQKVIFQFYWLSVKFGYSQAFTGNCSSIKGGEPIECIFYLWNNGKFSLISSHCISFTRKWLFVFHFRFRASECWLLSSARRQLENKWAVHLAASAYMS